MTTIFTDWYRSDAEQVFRAMAKHTLLESRLVWRYCVSTVRGKNRNGFACFVRMPGNGKCLLHRMGFQAPEQNHLAARQNRHECDINYVAGVSPVNHAVDGRPGFSACLQSDIATTSPAYRAMLSMPHSYFQ
ncbi:hypothetical protein PoB_002315100 [Plakobranchus ocellatus]|uniref:Uncharacterized protein n=1 Tax=Plakobranchus ocellatus TaxID=259542 RepID=A0AAV3ZL47_9GAST|nr:hypothetical protein PoB_002315100 [Plakobranchus ocellatus]